MAGSSIAHYNLLEQIGEGALGTVMRARDTKVGRTVALKILPGDPASRAACPAALVEDARAVAALSHPNIATLFEVGHADGACYLAYEFVAGALLRAAINGPMNPQRAVELAAQVADALATIEAAGLVHGDLRPETIAVTAKGAAKLLDTGMSRWTRGGAVRRTAAEDPESLTADAAAIVNYLAPEQALGTAADGRADIFSLGVILYEMLTGRSPFAGAVPQQTVVNVIGATPPPPSLANPGLPVEIDAIVAKALAKDISQRYETAAVFASDLRRIATRLDAAAAQRSDAYVLPLDDRADRIPLGVWLASAAGLAAVAAVVWWSLR